MSRQLAGTCLPCEFFHDQLYACCVPYAVAVRAKQDAFVEFFQYAGPAVAEIPTDVEVLFGWIRVVKLKRSDAFIVATICALASEVLDGSKLSSNPPKQRDADKATTATPWLVLTAGLAVDKRRSAIRSDARPVRSVCTRVVLPEGRAREAKHAPVQVAQDAVYDGSNGDGGLTKTTVLHVFSMAKKKRDGPASLPSACGS